MAYHSPGGKSGRETGQKLNSAVRDVREQAVQKKLVKINNQLLTFLI